ncbi:MAG: hypothetical protein IPM17_01030 [Verrucomicrobia bacterium]|jgi:hypothetical protein|nr:hypothetical protein [Verrucomicrobiota bacterium]
MKLLNRAAVILAAASLEAQFAGGSGMMGGGLSGVGGSSFGGVIVARVNVAPSGGGLGLQGGGMGFQGGGGGGLFGVTRPSLMATPNTQAAQFFSSGGVNLPVREAPAIGGAAAGGMYFAAHSPSRNSATGLVATTDFHLPAPAEEPLPAVPFAPPPSPVGKTPAATVAGDSVAAAGIQPPAAAVAGASPRPPAPQASRSALRTHNTGPNPAVQSESSRRPVGPRR